MKAMVLCAGYGTRLGVLTREVPKAMLPLGDRPLLAYVLGNVRRHGFQHIAINLHFRPELIRDHFGDGARWGLELTYSIEPELLGTAGGVKRMESFFRSEPAFLVHYGDILTDQDLGALWGFHRERRALATLLLHERARSNSVVEMGDDGRITGFLERPSDAAREGLASRWVNSGVHVFAPEVLDFIPAGQACDWPRDVFPKLIASGRVFGFPLSGHRCAVDSPTRLAEARQAVEGRRCRIAPLR